MVDTITHDMTKQKVKTEVTLSYSWDELAVAIASLMIQKNLLTDNKVKSKMNLMILTRVVQLHIPIRLI